MERAIASRMRIQQAREDGDQRSDRVSRLRAALAATPSSGGPLRIAVLSRLSPSSSSSSPDESDVLDAFETAEERDAAREYAERVLVPAAVAALSRRLRVRLPPSPGAPLIPSGALPASGTCGAAHGVARELGERKDLAQGEADLALFVTAASGQGELCPPGAVAWAVACARDAQLTGRPLAAAINLCPRVLEQGPGGMPVERAVAAVVHELVHVMVSDKR
jgi:hypothetical protein